MYSGFLLLWLLMFHAPPVPVLGPGALSEPHSTRRSCSFLPPRCAAPQASRRGSLAAGYDCDRKSLLVSLSAPPPPPPSLLPPSSSSSFFFFFFLFSPPLSSSRLLQMQKRRRGFLSIIRPPQCCPPVDTDDMTPEEKRV
ncbi:hypothetical protein JOB18_011942 [Solea senegalensis]|uniref:Secreted protein n=1 Tax=Solea senegalensis TaxID=28829 RepID=A0AAV6RBD6_SOLSE|nr:hypothetical protein JOB18_011942 [Solea senegalensis]